MGVTEQAARRSQASGPSPAVATAIIRSLLGVGEVVAGRGPFEYSQWVLADDDISIARVVSRGNSVHLDVRSPQELVGVVVREGLLTLRRDEVEVVLEPGDCGLVTPFDRTLLRWDEVRMELFCLPMATVADLLPQAVVNRRLLAPRSTPRSTQLGRFWHLLAQLVSSQVLTTPGVGESALIRTSMLHSFAAATVEAFELADEHPVAMRTVAATLHAVDAYLAERLGETMAIGDIARAVHLSPRALQLAYQQSGGETPMAHLRRLRLEAAHSVLNEHAGATTVTAVARRFGYTNVGRFAAHYRERFGETPGATLQQRAARR